jgi:cytochrome oxidase Cu insertion factor (SCO1/SenC/PrrC family)
LENQTPEKRRRGRLKLALLGAFFVLPFVASWAIWKLDLADGATGNYGTLIAPRPAGLPAHPALKGKWVLVQFDAGACATACERKLYFMRQVRRAQGREMGRIARLWAVTDAARPAPALVTALEDTVIIEQGAALAAAFPAEAGAARHIYLVDPMGNLMMRFPEDPDPSRVIKDLKHLLKFSGFG